MCALCVRVVIPLSTTCCCVRGAMHCVMCCAAGAARRGRGWDAPISKACVARSPARGLASFCAESTCRTCTRVCAWSLRAVREHPFAALANSCSFVRGACARSPFATSVASAAHAAGRLLVACQRGCGAGLATITSDRAPALCVHPFRPALPQHVSLGDSACVCVFISAVPGGSLGRKPSLHCAFCGTAVARNV